MDALVTNAVIIEQNHGKIPAGSVQFFGKDKPSIAVAENLRVAFLRFKSNKEKNTKRENMAVTCTKFDPDNFGDKPGHEMMQSLFNDYHDSVLVRCADGEISWEDANNQDWIVKDFHDSTRTKSGRKISKESIAVWYDSGLANTVELRAKTKNAQMTEETVAKVKSGYKEMFQKLTGYNLTNLFTNNQLELLTILMVSTDFAENDEIAEYMLEKITKIQAAKKEQDSLIDAI